MSILSDAEIIERAEMGMIEPFKKMQIRVANEGKVISFGVSSYGYDMRIANEFKTFVSYHNTHIIDPKNYDERNFTTNPARTHSFLKER